jgi:hypothetical protein
MNTFQPWQDTIPLLAGAQSTRSTRPGEHFEESIDQPSEKHARKSLLTYAAQLLMLLRLPHV